MQTLKERRIWGCWIFTVVEVKKTKKPISVHVGETGADESHSCTWGTYKEAAEAKEKYGKEQ
jgi:hypothetical protein